MHVTFNEEVYPFPFIQDKDNLTPLPVNIVCDFFFDIYDYQHSSAPTPQPNDPLMENNPFNILEDLIT